MNDYKTFSLNRTFNQEVIQELYPVIRKPPASAKAREWLSDFCFRPIDRKSNDGKANNLDAFASVCDRNTLTNKIDRETALLDEAESKVHARGSYGVPMNLVRIEDSDWLKSAVLEDFEVICEAFRLISDFLADEEGIYLQGLITAALRGTPHGISKLVRLLERYNDFEEFAEVKYLWSAGKMTTMAQRVSGWMQENSFKILIQTILENTILIERLGLTEHLALLNRRF